MTVQDRAGHCMLWKQLPAAEEAPNKQQRTPLSEQAESGLKSAVLRGEYWMRDFCVKGGAGLGLYQLLGKDSWLWSALIFLWRKSKRSICTETDGKARAGDWDRRVREKSLLAGLGTGMPSCCGDILQSSSTDHPHCQEVGEGHVWPSVAAWGSLAGYRAARAQGTGAVWVRSWGAMSVTAPMGLSIPWSHTDPPPLTKAAWQNHSINWSREKRRDFLEG